MLKTTLEQWRMLHAVVNHGGFAQAAEAVHKSQSTIHHAVHKLEELLGVEILEVKGRKAELTEAGKLLLRRSDNLLKLALQVEEVAAGLAQGVEAQIRLAVDVIFPPESMYCALRKFSDQYPNTRVEVIETVLSGAEELLRQGICDLVVSPTMPQGFIGTWLMTVEFVPVAHPEHPLHQLGRKITREDLAEHRQIVMRDSGSDRRDAGWLGSDQRWTVSHMSTSVDMVCRGLGIAWLPTTWVDTLIVEEKLKILPLREEGKRLTPLYLAYSDFDRQGPAAQFLGGQITAMAGAA